MSQILSIALVLLFTIFSGIMDARGFVYAARAWPDGRLDIRIAAASILAFAIGVSCYIISVRFMKTLGVHGVALQSAIWFAVTAIGIALMDGTLLQWSRAQKLVAFAIAVGLAWLLTTIDVKST